MQIQKRVASASLAVAAAVLCVLGTLSPSFAESENARAVRRPAASQQRDQTVLILSGVIQPGAYRQFRAAISRGQPALIVLDSPGGVLGEALMIGDEVRRRGLNTLVGPNNSCASACAVVFLSGRTKFMGKGASVGLHSAFNLDGKVDKEATHVMATYLSGVGVPKTILRRMAATGPTQMRWLTRAEQKALRIRPMR